MMKSIFALARFFSKSLLKEKSTLLLVFLALFLMVITLAFSSINIAQPHKLFEDTLFTSQMGLLHLAALLYSYLLLQKEKHHALFILPLSTNLSRETYVLGKYSALLLTLGVLFVAFVSIDSLIISLIEGQFLFDHILLLTLYFLSAALLAFLVLLFSEFVSLTNSVIYALLLFMVGNGVDEFYIYTHFGSTDNDFLLQLATLFYYGSINFSLYDQLGELVNRQHEITFLMPLLYFIGISLAIVAIHLIKFKHKGLKIGD